MFWTAKTILMKKTIIRISDWIEDRLKGLIGEITPDKQITVVLVMLLLFTIGSLYFSITSIYDWGKESGKKELIDSRPHIYYPFIEPNDSTYHQNEDEYEFDR